MAFQHGVQKVNFQFKIIIFKNERINLLMNVIHARSSLKFNKHVFIYFILINCNVMKELTEI